MARAAAADAAGATDSVELEESISYGLSQKEMLRMSLSCWNCCGTGCWRNTTVEDETSIEWNPLLEGKC